MLVGFFVNLMMFIWYICGCCVVMVVVFRLSCCRVFVWWEVMNIFVVVSSFFILVWLVLDFRYIVIICCFVCSLVYRLGFMVVMGLLVGGSIVMMLVFSFLRWVVVVGLGRFRVIVMMEMLFSVEVRFMFYGGYGVW